MNYEFIAVMFGTRIKIIFLICLLTIECGSFVGSLFNVV